MSTQPPGWYPAQGDPAGTNRYWDGSQWVGEPQGVVADSVAQGMNMSVGGQQLADPWKRIGARVLDFLILMIPAFIFALVLVGVLFASAESGAIDEDNAVFGNAFGFGATLIVGILAFLWDALWVHFKGGTPGKLMLGMQVIKEDGSTAEGQPAFMRALNRIIGVIPVVGGLIGPLIGLISLVLLFVDDKNRTVMDRIGGTIVVDK